MYGPSCYFFWGKYPFKIIFPCYRLHNFSNKPDRDFTDCFVFFLNCGTHFNWLLALYFSTASRLLLGFFDFGQLLLKVILFVY